jgi:hypothetical protein
VAAGPLFGLGIERFGIGCVPWLMVAVCVGCALLSLTLTLCARGVDATGR